MINDVSIHICQVIEYLHEASQLGSRMLKESDAYEHAHALTRKAIFFNLFIAENCLRRESTAGSSDLSGATPFSLIHG